MAVHLQFGPPKTTSFVVLGDRCGNIKQVPGKELPNGTTSSDGANQLGSPLRKLVTPTFAMQRWMPLSLSCNGNRRHWGGTTPHHYPCTWWHGQHPGATSLDMGWSMAVIDLQNWSLMNGNPQHAPHKRAKKGSTHQWLHASMNVRIGVYLCEYTLQNAYVHVRGLVCSCTPMCFGMFMGYLHKCVCKC